MGHGTAQPEISYRRSTNGWRPAYATALPVDIAVTLAEDQSTTFELSHQYAHNESVVYSITTPPAVGELNVSDNLVTYTPPSNWHGSTDFTWAATYGDGNLSTTAITVTPVNMSPSPSTKTAAPTKTCRADLPRRATLTATI